MPTEREQVIARLEHLVRLETPSGDVASMTRAAQSLTSRWRALGFDIREVETPAGPVIVADLPASGVECPGPVLFVTHLDTVWPLETIASTLPWKREGGVIRGPGVYDMKSGIVAVESAVARLRQAEAPHPALRIFVAVDEETGSLHSAPVLTEAARGCCAAIGMESPHPDGALKVGRYGSTRALVSVRGRQAHAALDPELGVSATEELVDQLVMVRRVVADAPDGGGHAVLYNLGGIDAPGRANVVNDTAHALLGFRFPTPAQERHVLQALKQLAASRPGAAVEVEVLSRRAAWAPRDADSAFAHALWPEGPSARVAAGAADTNALGTEDIPVVDGMGPRGGGAHSLDEHIVEESLWQRIGLLETALQSDPSLWCGRGASANG